MPCRRLWRPRSRRREIVGRLADVRDRERIVRLLKDFRPDIVFHAAALKHVPLLERRLGRGRQDQRVRLGQCRRCRDRGRRRGDGDDLDRQGDRAGVGAGRDQALCRDVLPGARRRCRAARDGRRRHTRFISVRFGNVLASNGSVVPKFKAQIEAGGPVTVTHPDMVRYFMTIREACDLVVSASSHALGPERSDVSVYVLNMGQPVKISELAERMIRLSGPRARPRHRDRIHRHTAGRAAQRNSVRARRGQLRNRHQRRGGGAAGQSAARYDAGLACDAGARACARGAGGDLCGAARSGAGFPRRGGLSGPFVALSVRRRRRARARSVPLRDSARRCAGR